MYGAYLLLPFVNCFQGSVNIHDLTLLMAEVHNVIASIHSHKEWILEVSYSLASEHF